MKPGTLVRLEDGREATVVYHGLDGYGVQFGRKTVDVNAIKAGCGSVVGPPPPDPYDWLPEYILKPGEYEVIS